MSCSGEPSDGGTAGASGSGGAVAGAAGAATGGTAGSGGSSQPTGGASSGASTGGGAGAAVGGSGGSGSGGAGGNAGAGGSGGAHAGSAGMGGSGGAGGGGGAGSGPKPSMGCEKATTQALDQWVDSMVMTSGANRPYAVHLPLKYDEKRAYPVIVLLHGCGDGKNNVPMEDAVGTDAILVRGTGSAASTCWDTAANGKDVAFFDDMVKDVKARFCADESRVFAVGYSSGSWLVNQLTCIRADVLRGGASVTGGESASGQCGGPVARIFIHDSDDTTNVISGSEKARDRQLTQNKCDKAAPAMAVDPSPCKLYQGCAAGYPVEWCQTSGKQHGRQDSFAPTTFWNFFKKL
jgi:poly(3-hydroxybutyrate) depolymerase